MKRGNLGVGFLWFLVFLVGFVVWRVGFGKVGFLIYKKGLRIYLRVLVNQGN